MPTKIKICGIRRSDDISYLNEYMPDYAGFIFAKSKRQLSIQEAEFLVKNLDKSIEKVGVFVNSPKDFILQAVNSCSLDVIQLHGDESPEFVEDIKAEFINKPVSIWKVFRVKDIDSLCDIDKYKVDAFLLDTYTEASYGGAGIVFNWDLAIAAKKHGNIILAGGLVPDNINEAIQKVIPYAVDTSSGVETEGIKDRTKIRDFVYNARYNTY
jgi:phosphoribosylanthranilate isomerase